MTPAEVEQWVLDAPLERLEQRVRGLSSEGKRQALARARDINQAILEGREISVSEAGIKMAVVILGALAPWELDDPIEERTASDPTSDTQATL